MKDRIINSDCIDGLKQLADNSVNCCVTSPPYYALRDYGMEGQIGHEATPEKYIEKLIEVFHEVKRVLRPDGTLWLNIYDTYYRKSVHTDSLSDPKYPNGRTGHKAVISNESAKYKAKDMIGIPWMLAFSLRDDGWYLRSDIIWYKANPMPEGVRDRPSRCYEHIFLLAKSGRYFYDKNAVAEPMKEVSIKRMKGANGAHTKHSIKPIPGQKAVQPINRPREAGALTDCDIPKTRNKRDVWQINTVPYKGGHYAAFPPKLAETCILAGCPKGGIVLDPFFGSGTTGAAARELGRHYIGIELNPDYCKLAEERIRESVI